MRILFFSNEFPSPWLPDKAAFNFELARSLARRHQVQVVAPIPWFDDLQARSRISPEIVRSRKEARAGLTIDYPRYYYLPRFGRRWSESSLWHSVRSTLQRSMDAIRPDAVLAYWTHPDGTVAVRAARQCGAAAYVMVGGTDVLVMARQSSRQRGKIVDTLRAADGVFVVSQDLRRAVEALGVPADRVHLVYRGVDRDRFSPGDQSAARLRLGVGLDRPVFLFAGRLAPIKGTDILLEAAAVLHGQGTSFELVIVGEGPDQGRLERSAGRLGLDRVVRFTGTVPHHQLGDWYRAADWTVLTSRSEGVPNVLLESHACGTPFIATRVGGVAEIAAAGVDRLAAPENPAAFARQMKEALRQPRVDRPMLAEGVASLDEAAGRIAAIMQGGPRVPSRPGAAAPSSAPSPLHNGIAEGAACPRNAGHAVENKNSALAPIAGDRPSRRRQLLRRMFSAVLPRRLFITGGPRDSRQACLTFDDGPHPDHTPRLLDVLHKLGVQATFFLVGERAACHPDVVRRIVAEGHEIGNHTWSHRHPYTLSASAFTEEVRRARDVLFELAGRSPVLFRPPHGKVTPSQLLRAWHWRQTVVLWNHDPKDFSCHSASDLAAAFEGRPLRAGDIVLFHDNHPHAVEILPDLVSGARRTGLSFVTPSAWLRPASRARRVANP